MRRASRLACLACLAFARVASADGPDGVSGATQAPPPVQRAWSYLDDPRLAAPMQAVVQSRATYTDSGTSPTRPFASNTGAPGGAFELGGEVGLVPRVAITASGVAGIGAEGEAANRVGGVAGVRVSLLPEAWRGSNLVVAAGYLRELTDANGAWLRVVGTQDLGRLRLGGSMHAEHVFLGGRDAADVMVTAGASVRVAQPLRLGVEYVGQDLEEAAGDAAEGGARHFIGPTGAISLLGDRLSIVAGPALGLSAQSPRFVGRVGVAYSF